METSFTLAPSSGRGTTTYRAKYVTMVQADSNEHKLMSPEDVIKQYGLSKMYFEKRPCQIIGSMQGVASGHIQQNSVLRP
jgi:hypothetical protein